jgi:hypothetical protein
MRKTTTVLASIAGFCVGFVATFLIGIEETSDWRCDGPCFDRWGEVMLIGVLVGGAVAVLCGVGVWSALRNADS